MVFDKFYGKKMKDKLYDKKEKKNHFDYFPKSRKKIPNKMIFSSFFYEK